MRLTVRWMSWAYLALGLGLLIWLLQGTELRQIWAALVQIGWRVLVLIPLAFLWMIPNTKAWECSFRSQGACVPFAKLMAARIAGESVNDLLPSSNLGGEPLKALLLRPSVKLAEALSSVTVAKTTQALAIVIFILGGLGLAAWQASLPPELVVAAGVIVAMLGTGVAVLALGSSSGLLGGWARHCQRHWPNAEWLQSLVAHALETDACLAAFYRREKGRFLASTLWHLAGLVLGSVELYLIGRFLGLSLSLPGALIMETVATLAAVGGFFIPGSLGAFEFGHYMAALMLGMPPAAGILISFVRRFRELFWLLAGLVLLYLYYPAAWKSAATPT